MQHLSQEQAQQLWEAGGFIVITDLPQGSEFGIDGTYHVTRKFSGVKFLPPGLHLVSWSPPPSNTAGPSTIPIRTALLRITKPRERIILNYDRTEETIPVPTDNEDSTETLISDDRLKTLDPELAAYPFDGLEKWKDLTNWIDEGVLKEVIGKNGRVDGMVLVDGEEDEVSELKGSKDVKLEVGKMERLKFPKFDLKRSWRDGAVGDEVTRYSRDKSWLMGKVIQQHCDGDSMRLLSYLQLSFILLLHLSSYSCLMVYKRFLSLLTHSTDILSSPSTYLNAKSDLQTTIARLYTSFLHILTTHLTALPDGSFEGELPEMDLFYLDELGYLREGLRKGCLSWNNGDRESVKKAWTELQTAGKRWDWSIPDLQLHSGRWAEDEEEEEVEEGEYAPVIVEM